MLADQRREKEGISVLLYLDIVNAFNSTTHRAIFSILEAMGFPVEMSRCFAECTRDPFWLWLINLE